MLQSFLNKSQELNIISQDKLIQYFQFCIDKNQGKRIREDGVSKTSHHHILPNKLFPEFASLKENPWNGTNLLYSDHYYAHWLFTEAVNDYSQLHAFCAMHNCDMKLGRINESDLIHPDKFQSKMAERSVNISEWYVNNPDKVKIKVIKRYNSID